MNRTCTHDNALYILHGSSPNPCATDLWRLQGARAMSMRPAPFPFTMRAGLWDEEDAAAWASLGDSDLIRRAFSRPDPERSDMLGVLYGRYYARVARWSVRLSSDPETARDLAQEIFLRVHDRIESFRFESKFSTWLYSVARSVALNRRRSASRRPTEATLDADLESFTGISADAVADVEAADLGNRLAQALDAALEPEEAEVVLLHYREGLTVNAITQLLGLDNKSGAKAHLVSAKRKLRRHFQNAGFASPANGGER